MAGTSGLPGGSRGRDKLEILIVGGFLARRIFICFSAADGRFTRQFAPLFAAPHRMRTPDQEDAGGLRDALYKKETRLSKRRMTPMRRLAWRMRMTSLGVAPGAHVLGDLPGRAIRCLCPLLVQHIARGGPDQIPIAAPRSFSLNAAPMMASEHRDQQGRSTLNRRWREMSSFSFGSCSAG